MSIHQHLLIPVTSVGSIAKPKSMGHMVTVFGQCMTLSEAEQSGMVEVQRDRDGKVKRDADGYIRYTLATVH